MKQLTTLIALLLIAALLGACSVGGTESAGQSSEVNASASDASGLEPEESGADLPSGSEEAPASGDTSEAPQESGNDESSVADGQPNEQSDVKNFTSPVIWESEGIEFCLPEDRQANMFMDCGMTCMVTCDCYDGDVVAYHEYDGEGETVKKTVGSHTYDYQSFDYLGLKNWHIFVIRIAFTESRNQMEHRYYKILFTAYGEGYPESQVEKFMETLRFTWFDKD